jgi:DNA repair exonuclease SbcCD ATPase subunit
MIINNIGLKNFKSYGNNMQRVPFKNGGDLILLSGDNEAGKSSLIESIDFTLYGVVRGKNTKKIALVKLPNRLNKNLETEINFINDDGDNILIRRKLEPTSIEVYKNSNNFFKEFKAMTIEQREKFIGLEYNTYKSLISLNLSDFANFVNLDTDTKRKLLNKLFNITEIDEYFSIGKEIVKNSYKEKERLESILLSNTNTIDTYNENISNIKSQTTEVNKEEIKNEILSYKDTYTILKQAINDLNTTSFQLSKDFRNKKEILEGKRNKIMQENFILKEFGKKIEIFKSGICPVCDSKLDTEDKKHKLVELEKEESDQLLYIDTLKQEYTISVNEIKELSGERTTTNNELNKKSFEFNQIDSKLRELKNLYQSNDIDSVSIIEIKRNISKLEHDNLELNRKLLDVKKKIDLYEKTVDYLSEKGIRKNIIKTIIDPINKNLEIFLKKIESNYNVKLNDEFDAVIKDRFMDIDSETLSIGGARKINIAIALSYIKTILDLNKRINILFLDEVFSSISPSNINIMLRVLKDFAKENNINILIVHQINFDENKFDRIIHIEKKYFSMITDSYKKKEE